MTERHFKRWISARQPTIEPNFPNFLNYHIFEKMYVYNEWMFFNYILEFFNKVAILNKNLCKVKRVEKTTFYSRSRQIPNFKYFFKFQKQHDCSVNQLKLCPQWFLSICFSELAMKALDNHKLQAFFLTGGVKTPLPFLIKKQREQL